MQQVPLQLYNTAYNQVLKDSLHADDDSDHNSSHFIYFGQLEGTSLANYVNQSQYKITAFNLLS